MIDTFWIAFTFLGIGALWFLSRGAKRKAAKYLDRKTGLDEKRKELQEKSDSLDLESIRERERISKEITDESNKNVVKRFYDAFRNPPPPR